MLSPSSTPLYSIQQRSLIQTPEAPWWLVLARWQTGGIRLEAISDSLEDATLAADLRLKQGALASWTAAVQPRPALCRKLSLDAA